MDPIQLVVALVAAAIAIAMVRLSARAHEDDRKRTEAEPGRSKEEPGK